MQVLRTKCFTSCLINLCYCVSTGPMGRMLIEKTSSCSATRNSPHFTERGCYYSAHKSLHFVPILLGNSSPHWYPISFISTRLAFLPSAHYVFLAVFPVQAFRNILAAPLTSPCMVYISRASHYPQFDHSNNIRWNAPVVNLFVSLLQRFNFVFHQSRDRTPYILWATFSVFKKAINK